MKANSRRRVLISSIAMLLVALVALSTATFAWFTEDTDAVADGIKVKTSQQSSLQIAPAAGTFGSGFSYGFENTAMMPASSLNGGDWFSAVAKDANNFAAGEASSVKAITENMNKYVFVDQLNVKNAGQITVNDVIVTVTGFEGHNYARFALVPATANAKGAPFILTPDTTDDAEARVPFGDYVYANDATAYAPLYEEGVIPGDSATKITPSAVTTSYTIDLADSLEANEEIYFNLYVWFEGQDADCNTGNAGTGFDNLTFTVSGTPEETN